MEKKSMPSWFHVQAATAAAVPDLSLGLVSGASARGRDEDEEAAPTARVDGKTVRLFQCLFCDKTFLKSQALGGHQNAHRKDRLFNDPYLCEPYGDGALHGAAPSTGTGQPCESSAERSMSYSIASHGGGVAASTPTAAVACRLERWTGVAPRFPEHVLFQDPSASSRDSVVGRSRVSMASGAGEKLDLELRL
uniref:Uncharacterized protein n=1 Tax=Avena sativa TaxID=4498 RepID=A0ACD5WHF6_AVESA